MGALPRPSGIEPAIGRRADRGWASEAHSPPDDPSRIIDVSATIVVVTVRFTPAEPPLPPRLEHVRDLWQMLRPHRPQHVLTASIYETDTGRELRVGFSLTNLIHSELSRKGDGPLEARAEDVRVSLLESGSMNLEPPTRDTRARTRHDRRVAMQHRSKDLTLASAGISCAF